MNLPAIDIPVQLPFEVPLLVHPVVVHFAIAIPVIVFLLELANIKARNRAVSVTSLFLMTLALLVYAGAFFTGKADGSHAFDMLGDAAQEELGFHKLLGTYMVYGIGVLFVMKILAMLVKRPWARDMFIAFLLVFIGIMFKQGKDGGELVYKYGVNVAPVMAIQQHADETTYEEKGAEKAEEATHEAAPAAESATENTAPATEENGETTEQPAAEEAAPASDESAASSMEEQVKSATEEAGENAAEAVHEAAEAGEAAAHEAAEDAEETLHDAVGEMNETEETPTH